MCEGHNFFNKLYSLEFFYNYAFLLQKYIIKFFLPSFLSIKSITSSLNLEVNPLVEHTPPENITF